MLFLLVADRCLKSVNGLSTAARIQQAILPQSFPPPPHRTEFDAFARVVPAKECDSHKLVLRRGDTVLLYTDGVTEAMTAHGQLYGEVRLVDALRQSDGAPPKEMLESLQTKLADFAGGAPQADDFTMLALRYNGKAAV